MTGPFLPGAVWRPVSYRGDAGRFTSPPLGWILHVVVGNGSPFGSFENAPAGSRRFSTAWVGKDGRSEQYTELTGKSWAQAAGNGTYWSFETEGYPAEPLTDAQITTLATWHDFLGVTDTLAEAPGQRGIGTHFMGGAAWGGHTCPDPVAGAGPRSRQRTTIIDRARALRGPSGGFGSGVSGSGTYVPLPPITPGGFLMALDDRQQNQLYAWMEQAVGGIGKLDERSLAADRLWGDTSGRAYTVDDTHDKVLEIHHGVGIIQSLTEAYASVKPDGTLEPGAVDAIATQIAAALGTHFDVNLTVTPKP